MTDLGAEIFRQANERDGRYLLPKRWRKPMPFEEKDHRDHLHDACEALVDSGHARWIPGWSNLAPGIELTGKPLPSPPTCNRTE